MIIVLAERGTGNRFHCFQPRSKKGLPFIQQILLTQPLVQIVFSALSPASESLFLRLQKPLKWVQDICIGIQCLMHEMILGWTTGPTGDFLPGNGIRIVWQLPGTGDRIMLEQFNLRVTSYKVIRMALVITGRWKILWAREMTAKILILPAY